MNGDRQEVVKAVVSGSEIEAQKYPLVFKGKGKTDQSKVFRKRFKEFWKKVSIHSPINQSLSDLPFVVVRVLTVSLCFVDLHS